MNRSSVLIAGVLAGCGTCELSEELTSHAGPGARDCGSVAIEADPAAVDSCVASAITDGAPFFAQYHRQGDDSKVVSGVAGNSNGQVYFLTWDSAPCGGPSCDPVISSDECIGPSVRDDQNQSSVSPPIDCDRMESHGRICEE